MWNKGSHEERSHDLYVAQRNCCATEREVNHTSFSVVVSSEGWRLSFVVVTSRSCDTRQEERIGSELSPPTVHPLLSRLVVTWLKRPFNHPNLKQRTSASVERPRDGSSDGQTRRSLPEITLFLLWRLRFPGSPEDAPDHDRLLSPCRTSLLTQLL